MNPAEELEKIEAALNALAAAPEGAAMAAARQALLERKQTLLQSIAASQQRQTSSLGQGAIMVDGNVRGDVVTGVKIEQRLAMPGADPAELRKAYLARLLENASRVSLTGIDPKASDDANAHLNLSAVYTALLTLSGEDHAYLEQGGEPNQDMRYRSALDQLNQHPRLVLLGDPGSGKSTFVNFVTLCLAGQGLGHGEINLNLLTAPLPEDEQEMQKTLHPAQPWHHGALLPLRVILRDFAARGLPPPGQPATAKHLWDFITADLKAASLQEWVKHLGQELFKDGGLLLLDGLDEVPEANARRVQIKQAVEDFAATFHKCRILVTSRTYAYQKQDWRLQRFQEAVLAPFTLTQIGYFIDHWYAQIAQTRGMDKADAQGRAKMLKRAVLNSSRLLGLAERPLLLTLMASLHAWRSGSLPEKREELYAATVALLLDWWERPKVVRDANGQPLVQQQSLSEWIKTDPDKVRGLLNELAYQAHAGQAELSGTADISEGALVMGLMRLSNNPDVNPVKLVDYLSQRAGLLIPRGVGVYTFPHRTFQEYLAACYLTDHDYPYQAAELASVDFNRWREAVLLAGAKAGRGTPSALWSLVDALCFDEVTPDSPEANLWGAHLAGQALAETADLSAMLGQRQGERNRPKLERVRRGLIQVLKSKRMPAIERASAGLNLERLGDPRLEVITIPAMEFCFIPPGSFVMGNSSYDDEKPQHVNNCLAYPYWIGRWPVTSAQWLEFVMATQRPFDRNQPKPHLNHPVVIANWSEARQFCAWLTETYPQGLPPGYHFDLPSEAEWEKAARGGLQIPSQPAISVLQAGLATFPSPGEMLENPAPQRDYPWMGEFDKALANIEATGIGDASALGCFPGSASPYGCEEMAGNVWEWMRSIWDQKKFPYPYRCEDGRENIEERRALRSLRGGSFYDDSKIARCTCRYKGSPEYWYKNVGFRLVITPECMV